VPEAVQSHFFISYTSADRVWAEWIAWQLEEAGYQVKIQAWDFSPGGNFVVEMQKATVECERDVIEKLHGELQRDRRAALSGLGGIGKTQTAIEYAHRYRNDHNAVFFIRTDTETALTAGMVEIAGVLALPERDAKDQNETVGAVKRWFLEHDRWLLIADNADELALVKNVLPFDGPGQILLTTRAVGTGAVAEAVRVRKMEPEEGARFLLRRAGLLGGDSSGHQLAPGDQQAAARELSIKLDGLPLALDQAGAFIEETPSSPIEYLQLYTEAGAELRRIGKSEHESSTPRSRSHLKKSEAPAVPPPI
jgi:predicted ATPase